MPIRLLDALADNGGYTQTMALGAGSSAIDTGTNTGCPATDQRGVTRPQGSHCDIGAYEYRTNLCQYRCDHRRGFTGELHLGERGRKA